MKMYLVIFVLLLSSAAYAEVVEYSCDYIKYSNPEGVHNVDGGFKLVFMIDKGTGKSFIRGNSGVEEVAAIPGVDRISFIEVTSTGNIMTTAIDQKLASVHSRNTIIMGELSPSQYYGKCVSK